MFLANHALRVMIDDETGAVCSLFSVAGNREFLPMANSSLPFEADFGSGYSPAFTDFTILEQKPDFARLRWTIRPGCVLTAEITLTEKGVSFTSAVEEEPLPFGEAVEGEPEAAYPYVRLIQYPILSGIGAIDETNDLLHPYATGMLIRNPITALADAGWNCGLDQMPYPECFSGCSMQFLTYYGERSGGLYFAALDGNFHHKWLNFALPLNESGKPDASAGLTFSHAYGYQNMDQPGLSAPYPVTVELLPAGSDWYDAADRYRSWATKQIWCSRGTYAEREARAPDDLPHKLLDQTGACTFGINGRHDRTRWLKEYKKHIDAPIFHISGPDWPATDQNYRNHLCGGWDDWFPTDYSQANIDVMHSSGDTFAPFEFNLFVNMHSADSDSLQEAWMRMPKKKYSLDRYAFSLLCPADPFTVRFHADRDVQIQKETGCDAMYYDISANNLLHSCVNPAHAAYHSMGGDCEITEGYRTMFRRTRDALRESTGRTIPIGTEEINEVFLDVLDYYQARAWAQPATGFEGWSCRPLIKQGLAKLVPAFTFVYHDYGAIRLDGWGKLVEEIGDLYYHTVAKTFLWGGIYELNYEYSPMEVVDGEENRSDEHYAAFHPRGYRFSDERADYLADYARLRIHPTLGRYLARGQMQKPLPFDIPEHRYSYFHYNLGDRTLEYNDGGTLAESAILHACWRLDGVGDALFFANPTEEALTVSVPTGRYRSRDGVLTDCFGGTKESVTLGGELSLTLPAHGCLAVELPE